MEPENNELRAQQDALNLEKEPAAPEAQAAPAVTPDTNEALAAPAVTAPAYASVLGKQSHLAVIIAVVTGVGTLWTLASRVIMQLLASYGARDGISIITAFSRGNQIVTALLFSFSISVLLLLCARHADERNRTSFFIGAAGYFMPVVLLALGYSINTSQAQAVLGAVLTPIGACLVAVMYLLLGIYRKNILPVRVVAFVCSGLGFANAVSTFAASFAGIQIISAENTSQNIRQWILLLSYGSMIQFFVTLALGVLGGLCFVLIYTTRDGKL